MRELVKEIVRGHLDKLLLTFIFGCLVGLTVHLIHNTQLGTGGTDFVNWAETQSGTVLGALLTLITGAVAKNALAQAAPPAKTQGVVVTSDEEKPQQ